MSKTILLDTFFADDIHGHGGNHRSAQIAELVQKASIEISRLDRKILKTKLSRYLAGMHAVINMNTALFIAKHKLRIGHSPIAIAFCGFQRQFYQNALRRHSGYRLLLWEATKNYVAPYVASDSGFRVIAMPHNLESLVPNQDAFFEEFETEIRSLAKADVVFCIAHEEEWLLRLNGVNAYFLPYYPPASLLDRLLDIRQNRLTAPKRQFLILGNANNPPTKQGMIEQLEWLQKVRHSLEFKVDIVGYGTEKLANYCDQTNFILHGAADTNALNNLLIHAKALLVHQTASTGALTRLPEALIAGVPVIGNTNACRSAFQYPGIRTYDDWFELADLLSRDLPMPDILDRPVSAEKRFINCLVDLAQSAEHTR